MGAAAASQSPELLRRLLRAKDRMDAASEEEWPVARLAQVSCVSAAHFARSFKVAFGLPPHRYLLSRRIERAKALLRETERAAAGQPGRVPACVLGAAHRPHLTMAVSEKRRRMAEPILGTQTKGTL